MIVNTVQKGDQPITIYRQNRVHRITVARPKRYSAITQWYLHP